MVYTKLLCAGEEINRRIIGIVAYFIGTSISIFSNNYGNIFCPILNKIFVTSVGCVKKGEWPVFKENIFVMCAASAILF